MQTRFVSRSLFTAIALAATLSTSAFAQQTVPDHPRVNEVNQRLENQQDRINAGEAKGQMTAGQAAADEKRDANIARRESVDEAKNGGHLTKAEQRHLNKSLNKNSRHIARQRHG
jgi:hypothetical protein